MPLDELLNIRQKIAFEFMKAMLGNCDLAKMPTSMLARSSLQHADAFIMEAGIEFHFNDEGKIP